MSSNRDLRTNSNRQLKAAEVVRRALAEIFREQMIYDAKMPSYSITVSEVRMSPDLRDANIYILQLGGSYGNDVDKNSAARERQNTELLDFLDRNYNKIRHLVTRKVNFRNSPVLHFKIDASFDNASRVYNLLGDDDSDDKDNDDSDDDKDGKGSANKESNDHLDSL